MKVLVFTSSYNRPYMLRQCILSVKNQSVKEIKHSVNITSEMPLDALLLINDLDDVAISITENNHTHFNNMTAIKAVENYESYDLFIKMDDDVDIVSSEIKFQLNGTEVYSVDARDLGGNTDVEYKMPMTYAFNKKALDTIINLEKKDMFGFDDMTWRIIWKAYKLKHAVVNNSQEVIWHIHGKNVSTGSFLK